MSGNSLCLLCSFRLSFNIGIAKSAVFTNAFATWTKNRHLGQVLATN